MLLPLAASDVLGPLGDADPLPGGGGIASPLDYDANLLGYWDNVAANILKEDGSTPVSSSGDHAATWVDLSSAGNDLVYDGLASYGLWRPNHAFASGGTKNCIESAHAMKLTADLASAYAGNNLAWVAKLAINTLTNNNA